MNADWRTRYELAIDAARQAGDLAHTYFDGAFEVEWKADQSPVTIADRRAEELVRAIAAKHPDSWISYLANDTLANSETNKGVDPKYRPRGYNEGPKE